LGETIRQFSAAGIAHGHLGILHRFNLTHIRSRVGHLFIEGTVITDGQSTIEAKTASTAISLETRLFRFSENIGFLASGAAKREHEAKDRKDMTVRSIHTPSNKGVLWAHQWC